VYSQLVTVPWLVNPVVSVNGLLTKLPNCVLDGVTTPAVGAPACGVAFAVAPADSNPTLSVAHAR